MKNTRLYLAVLNKEKFPSYYNEFKAIVDSLTPEEVARVLERKEGDDYADLLNKEVV